MSIKDFNENKSIIVMDSTKKICKKHNPLLSMRIYTGTKTKAINFRMIKEI